MVRNPKRFAAFCQLYDVEPAVPGVHHNHVYPGVFTGTPQPHIGRRPHAHAQYVVELVAISDNGESSESVGNAHASREKQRCIPPRAARTVGRTIPHLWRPGRLESFVW